MMREKLVYISVVFFLFAIFVFFIQSSVAADDTALTPQITPSGHIASQAEYDKAYAEWEVSEHAETYDEGLGANTTCARCKSPTNWDPTQTLAQIQALDCGSCKRIPGAPRPELQSGVPVALDDWNHVGCPICHIPAGNSVYTSLAYWDQISGQYQEVSNIMELCGHCHEGQHGFEVILEQSISPAHNNWECTKCHGAHGTPSQCQDCHDPTEGKGVEEHANHQKVNCTACHDAGNLSVWLDTDPSSIHNGEAITRRFAHTLTSWPSHNLQLEVTCIRCHHPHGEYSIIVASDVSCTACHPENAVLFWCDWFSRNDNPNPSIVPPMLP